MKTICFSILGNVFRYVKVINLKAGVLLHLPMRIVSFRILKILNGLRIGSKKEYMIQISINMIFSFMQNGRKSKTISKLEAKKKYYIRIRTYKKLKGNGKSYNIYSSRSKIKIGKVK